MQNFCTFEFVRGAKKKKEASLKKRSCCSLIDVVLYQREVVENLFRTTYISCFIGASFIISVTRAGCECVCRDCLSLCGICWMYSHIYTTNHDKFYVHLLVLVLLYFTSSSTTFSNIYLHLIEFTSTNAIRVEVM